MYFEGTSHFELLEVFVLEGASVFGFSIMGSVTVGVAGFSLGSFKTTISFSVGVSFSTGIVVVSFIGLTSFFCSVTLVLLATSLISFFSRGSSFMLSEVTLLATISSDSKLVIGFTVSFSS